MAETEKQKDIYILGIEMENGQEPQENGEKPRCTAIILAAGSGSRMQSAVAKQFLPLKEKPLIWYALHAVEESRIIDDCILVTAEQDIPYVREEIVQKYHFTKVNIITSGGAERYLSVGRALQLIADGRLKVPNEHGYVFIHDGARPFLTEKILEDTYAEVRIDGQNFTLGKYVSDNTSYSYYFSFPPYKATAGLGGTQLLFIFFALLALLTGGCLVYYFSRRNVRPIIELGQELQTAVEVQKNLQEVVDSQRPIICTSYVRQLLSGTATSEDEVTYMENYLGIADSSYYNVLYIVYYNNFGDNTEITLPGGVESMEELEKIIESALENFFGTPLFYFSPSDRTYSVLLHCSEEEEKDLILKINNCILRLHDYLLDTYDIWLFAGIGRNTDSLMNVWECYQQASEAVSYTTKNYIFFPYEFIKKDSNVFYYPPEISQP